MSFEVWLAFVLASAAVVLIPGPNIVLTVNHAIRDGVRSGWATVPGVVVGAGVGMSVSLAGAGAVLAASVTLFSILKFAGAAYLIWLAFRLWTAPIEQSGDTSVARTSLRGLFWQSFLVSTLNPKGVVFYMAFVPQFVRIDHPVAPQFALLIATFLAVAAINSIMWLFFASGLRTQLSRPKVMKTVNRVGATCMGTAGAFTANTSRNL